MDLNDVSMHHRHRNRINYFYGDDETVLCWHDEKLYPAKIQQRKASKQRGAGNGDDDIYNKQYLVHYHGWSKTWDEWVDEAKILKKTPQNDKLCASPRHSPSSPMKHKLDNIHNLNMNRKHKLNEDHPDDSSYILDDDLEDDSADGDLSHIQFLGDINLKSKRLTATKPTTTTMKMSDHSLRSKVDDLEKRLKAVTDDRDRWHSKYLRKAKRCKEFKEVSKRLYAECVHGDGPRWHLIEFRDTEHRVTRDAELADLRSKITSLYPKGSFDVSGITKWRGRTELEDSVKRFVELNGEYRIEAFTLIKVYDGNSSCFKDMTVDLHDVIQKYEIREHPRIPALNGQFGIKALCNIPRNTCFGQYFGGEILQDAFGKVFDGTGEEHDHNIYAFDQKIDKFELKKLKDKEKRMEMNRMNRQRMQSQPINVNVHTQPQPQQQQPINVNLGNLNLTNLANLDLANLQSLLQRQPQPQPVMNGMNALDALNALNALNVGQQQQQQQQLVPVSLQNAIDLTQPQPPNINMNAVNVNVLHPNHANPINLNLNQNLNINPNLSINPNLNQNQNPNQNKPSKRGRGRPRKNKVEVMRKNQSEMFEADDYENDPEYASIPDKVFIIDPFIGDWKNDELLLRYVNDCRADIDDKEPSSDDNRYYNVEFVGMKVNGWPQTYLIAKRDIKEGEELMTYYGTAFSDAITHKLEEEHRKKQRKIRIDADILQGVKL